MKSNIWGSLSPWNYKLYREEVADWVLDFTERHMHKRCSEELARLIAKKIFKDVLDEPGEFTLDNDNMRSVAYSAIEDIFEYTEQEEVLNS